MIFRKSCALAPAILKIRLFSTRNFIAVSQDQIFRKFYHYLPTLVRNKRMVTLTLSYFYLSNKRRGWNKSGGGAKVAKPINVEVGILQLESSPIVLK